MLLRLLFVFLITHVVFSEAFAFLTCSIPAVGVSVIGMSSATEATAANSNWRVLRRTDHDMESLLSERARWSESQYLSALELYDQLVACADSYMAPEIKDALNCLDHAYRLYGPESVLCSYNGGKDAVVILHLVRAAHAHYYRKCRQEDLSIQPSRPRAVYFDHKDEFPEVIELLHDTVEKYDLDMVAFEQGISFSDGLKILVDNNFHEGSSKAFPMAFVLGTRSSDPNAHSQSHFAPSSHYMPPFMRVNPVLDWTYGHVWHFLRLFQLPYCILYDMGYTSLGTVKDTRPCPALAVAGANKEKGTLPKYWPAYMLRDWDQERAGRVKKESKREKRSESKPSTAPVVSTGSSTVSQYSTLSNAVASTIVERDAGREVAAPLASSGNRTSLSDLESSVMSFSCNDTQRSVGLLIIGAEILKGMTVDTNTNAAAKALRENNVLLSRVVVVSDDQDEIMEEVRRLQAEVDVIITSGGVGPTHDDVTIKSVAAALDRKMVFNEEMAQLLRGKMDTKHGGELTEAQKKMATLPADAHLRYLSDNIDDWPLLQCRNVFVLPGIPELFSKKVNSLAEYLSTQLERSVTYKVVLSVDEASIVECLNTCVKRHLHVTFGSYPFVSHPEFKTVVTLEGRTLKSGLRSSSCKEHDEADVHFSKEQADFHVRAALDDLINTLPSGSILRVENDDGLLFL